MTYAVGFDHDVFISYAHLDNESLNKDEKGWVTQFHDDLQHLLDCLAGRKDRVSIWRDRWIEGHHVHGNLLDGICRNCAVIVAVCSPAYAESDWCIKRELPAFITGNHPEIGVNVGHCSRLFRVGLRSLQPTQASRILADPTVNILLDGMNGFDFFDRDTANRIDVSFRRTKQEDPDRRYWTLLHKLAAGIMESLNAVNARHFADGDARQVPVPTAPKFPAAAPSAISSVATPGSNEGSNGRGADEMTVYVAQTADDVNHFRKELIRELSAEIGNDRKIKVVPEVALPNSEPACSTEISRLLSQSRLAVHLFGSFPGQELANSEFSAPQLQYDLAMKQVETHPDRCQQMVWIQPEVDPQQCIPPQNQFLEAVLTRSAKPVPQISRASIVQFKEAVRSKFNVWTPPVRTRKAVNGPPALVFVYCAPGDKSADEVGDYLRQRSNDVIVAPPDADMEHFRTNVGASDGVLILYENAEPAWVQDRVMAARKIGIRRRRRGLRAGCVYQAPSPSPRVDLKIFFENWVIVNCRTGSNELSGLEAFVERLKDGV